MAQKAEDAFSDKLKRKRTTQCVAESNPNWKTRDASFSHMLLSNNLARLTGNISSRFLVVISQCL